MLVGAFRRRYRRLRHRHRHRHHGRRTTPKQHSNVSIGASLRNNSSDSTNESTTVSYYLVLVSIFGVFVLSGGGMRGDGLFILASIVFS